MIFSFVQPLFNKISAICWSFNPLPLAARTYALSCWLMILPSSASNRTRSSSKCFTTVFSVTKSCFNFFSSISIVISPAIRKTRNWSLSSGRQLLLALLKRSWTSCFTRCLRSASDPAPVAPRRRGSTTYRLGVAPSVSRCVIAKEDGNFLSSLLFFRP